jgi:hypothetical protein
VRDRAVTSHIHFGNLFVGPFDGGLIAGCRGTAGAPDRRPTLCPSPTSGWRRPSSPPARQTIRRVARGFLVLRIAHDHVGERNRQVELPARPPWGCSRAVFPRVGLTLGLDRDRSTVVRGADAARQEGAVVLGVVPSKPALVAGSCQRPTANLTDSIVSLLLSATVLPSASTSLTSRRFGTDHCYFQAQRRQSERCGRR